MPRYFLCFLFPVLDFSINFSRDLLAFFSFSITNSETGGDNLCRHDAGGKLGGNRYPWHNPNGVGVIYIVGLKCAPPRVDGVGGLDSIVREDIKDERIGVANSDGK